MEIVQWMLHKTFQSAVSSQQSSVIPHAADWGLRTAKCRLWTLD